MIASGEGERRRGIPLAWVFVAVLIVALLVYTVDVLLVLFLAIILAVYLDSVSSFLQRQTGMPPGVGLATGLVLSLGAIVGVVLLIAPAVTGQVQDLIANLPRYLSDLDQTLNRLFRNVPLLRRGFSGDSGTPGLLATSLSEMLSFLRGALVPYLKGGLELLIIMVSVVVMAVYLTRNPAVYVEGLVALVPPARRPLARVILTDLKLTLHSWVVGQIIAMVVLAVLTTLGLWALGLPYFLAFGIFAGVAAIVPFFGTLFSTLIPALFALGVAGLPKAVAVTALGIVVHLVEANFVAPVVMERKVNLPPVITIAGVLLIGKLFGLVGLIVAVPILAFVMVLVRHILLGEVYGDPISELKPSGVIPAEAEPTVTAQAALPSQPAIP
ncbi:MAG TPA: AI-2E family transporter [Gemmatimonadales bacterium]|nr:AI-2E family transporter [Gemmatimonadales bacterium]